MSFKLLHVVVTQFLLSQALSSYMQPYSQKAPYYQRDNRPQIKAPKSYPEYRQYYQPNYEYPTSYQSIPQNYQSYQRTEQPAPSVPLAPPVNIPPRPLPTPVFEPPKIIPPPVPQPETSPTKCGGNLDSHVLNNLAIALQLLIVSNIMNNPPSESGSQQSIKDIFESIGVPSIAGQVGGNFGQTSGLQMPNSKFLGSSNFGDDLMSKGIMGMGSFGPAVAPAPRSSMTLMSPYDAIGPNSPFADPILSSFVSNSDFVSPYASIMAADNNKDLFSMAELF